MVENISKMFAEMLSIEMVCTTTITSIVLVGIYYDVVEIITTLDDGSCIIATNLLIEYSQPKTSPNTV